MEDGYIDLIERLKKEKISLTEKAIEIAEQIANDSRAPGDLGKGQVIYTGPGTGIYVTFPLLYDGLPVVCINSPGIFHPCLYSWAMMGSYGL